MAQLRFDQLSEMDREQLRALTREELEELTWQLVEVARSLADKAKQNSTNSSRPPSSDDPYRRRDQRQQARNDTANRGDDTGDGDGGPPSSAVTGRKPAKPAGKRPGMPGFWRRQPMVVTCDVDHDAAVCAACGAVLGPAQRCRQDSAHYVYDLERSAMALQISAARHRYFAGRCACGHETIARPGTGRCSEIEGRRRNLQLTERCLVGPMLASFIAVLSIRFRLSRQKIQEFLNDWLGLELGTASIDRCIREFGLACEPVVEDLVEEIRRAEVVHLDETPWYQRGVLLWLWVAVSATTVVFHIGSRAKQELAALIGEAFLGWLVTDGYGAYRDHPRRQRCLAHLIRKAVALAEGYYRPGSGFGRDIARDLRSLIEKVAAGDSDASIKRLLARLKRNCQCNRYEVEDKVRALAREILNDLCGRPRKVQGLSPLASVAPRLCAVSPVRSLLAGRWPGVRRHNRAAPARHRALLPSRCFPGWRAGCPATSESGPACPRASAQRQPTVALACADRQAGGFGQRPAALSPRPSE